MPYIIGNIGSSSAVPKKLSHSSDTSSLSNGEVVQYLDHIFRWDADCISIQQSRHWRTRGDQLCDEALLEIFPNSSASVGVDLLLRLQSIAEKNPEGPARRFLDEVSKRPPANIQVSNEELHISQAFFLDNSIQILQALLYYSLAGGFAR